MGVDVITIYRETNLAGTQRELVLQAKGTARGGMFNPREISVQKTVAWSDKGGRKQDHPRVNFDGGGPRTITLSLLLDSYEERKDVREYTNKLAALARYDGDLHRPPVVVVMWGPDLVKADLPFRGVVTSLTQKFTLFTSQGTPVRATVDMSLKEYEPPGRQQRSNPETSPDQRKARTVRQGDSLWMIAAEEYDDPARWRPIAAANGIDNPRRLEPGTLLMIPVLE